MTALRVKPRPKWNQPAQPWEPRRKYPKFELRPEPAFTGIADELAKHEQRQQLVNGLGQLLAQRREAELGPVWAALKARWTVQEVKHG